MSKLGKRALSVVFFCSLGWVYPGSAIGDEGPIAPPATPLPKGQTVAVGSLGQIDLHVKDLELAKVLQLLSIQSRRNIIASKSVGGSISADLYGVDFYEALDAILHANGMGYVEKGNFIYVYTTAEMKTIAEAERRMSSRVVRLSYISAADASAFVQPMLSQGGSIAINSAATPGFSPSLTDGGANTYAHPDTLIIRDYPEAIDEIVRVVKELDVRPKQVLVDATVLKASLGERNEFGVDLNVLIDTDFSKFVSPINVIDALIGGKVVDGAGGASPTTPPYNVVGGAGGVQSGVGNTAKAGGTKLGILSKNVSAFIRALDEVTDTTVLAKPKLMVLNRQKADLLVGRKIGYLSTTTTDTSATQTVEFLEVGTKLALRPFISDEGFIRMELKPAISSGELKTTGNVVAPEETTQELTTNIMVRSGQTVVLGGLFQEETTIGRRQTPFLGDVPVLGAAFKGQDDQHDRSEVIFLITPTILKDQAMYAAGEQAKDNIEMSRIGARQGLLPWSRTKLTTSHLKNAQEHLQKGDREKALWSVNMALSLDPTLLDAMKMREELTGQRTYIPGRGVMDKSFDSIVDKQIESTTPAETKPAPKAEQAKPAETAVAPAAAEPKAAVPSVIAPSSVQTVPVAPRAEVTEPARISTVQVTPAKVEASEPAVVTESAAAPEAIDSGDAVIDLPVVAVPVPD